MARQLWLLRHGEAEPHDARADAERRLTPRGERQSEAAGAALARLGIEFAACYTSPRVRALDTARLACASLGVEPTVLESLSSGFDAGEALELLYAEPEDARIVLVEEGWGGGCADGRSQRRADRAAATARARGFGEQLRTVFHPASVTESVRFTGVCRGDARVTAIR
jgi:broad specificity phosphatase PhoE